MATSPSSYKLGIVMKEEIWKDISGYKGFYQVSNEGRIKGLNRIVHGFGSWRNGKRIKEKILKPILKNPGYYRVMLGRKSEKYIHRLVIEAFIPNAKNKKEINHKDGNKLNNNLNNLEWATPQENNNHSIKNKLNCFGERIGNSKLKEKQIFDIRWIKSKCNISNIALSKIYRVSDGNISMIINKKRWKHL